jgi:Holliday junction resolvasome RuvABC DNA-binding subunit
MSNREIARQLERVADLLEGLEANPFRVRSYRRVAEELRGLRRPAEELYVEGGTRRLQEIPGVGRALSSSIAEIVETGGLRLLERLEAERSPIEAFKRLPGVGEALAHRIHDELGVATLEELELAAHDGRLMAVEGIGEKRARGIRDALTVRLARTGRMPPAAEPPEAEARPSVGLLLDVDKEYRWRSRTGQLRHIAPRRFNPEGAAWLPIMEVERDGWDFKALFSNTQRAHELGRTRDWVVIYYHRDGDNGQATVVTARTGRLRELRAVRGRELECRRHYAEARKIA